MSPIIAVLAGTLHEMYTTLRKKYPDEILPLCAGNGARDTGSPAELEALLLRHAGDTEVREILTRRFRECGAVASSIPGPQPAPAGQRYDIFRTLDEESACILRILYERRFATLDELSECSGLTQYDVLHRLKEIIIPRSVKRRGKPIAVFRESGMDLYTGRQIAFSWWLNDDFQKKDAIEVVEADDCLMITLDRTGCKLPADMPASAAFRHGILEIRVDTGQRGGYHEKE